eukprot:3914096-Rhodomonas_salina.1
MRKARGLGKTRDTQLVARGWPDGGGGMTTQERSAGGCRECRGGEERGESESAEPRGVRCR